jgi:hypothetical protein
MKMTPLRREWTTPLAWGLAAALLPVGLLFAATSPTVEIQPAPGPGPVVFEYEIERTTEPLGLFNSLPPPVPLGDLKSRPHDAGSTVIAESSPPKPTPTPVAWRPAKTPARTPVRNRAPSRWTIRKPALTPRPTLPPRHLPDTVVLAGGKELACRILSEEGGAVQVELANGAIVSLPRHRVVQLKREAPTP